MAGDELRRYEVAGGATIEENDCGLPGDDTFQLDELTRGMGELIDLRVRSDATR